MLACLHLLISAIHKVTENDRNDASFTEIFVYKSKAEMSLDEKSEDKLQFIPWKTLMSGKYLDRYILVSTH